MAPCQATASTGFVTMPHLTPSFLSTTVRRTTSLSQYLKVKKEKKQAELQSSLQLPTTLVSHTAKEDELNPVVPSFSLIWQVMILAPSLGKST